MKLSALKYSVLLAFGVVLSFRSLAQPGAGSMTVDNSTVKVSAGSTELRFAEGAFFGPKANWSIDGVLEIWSKNIWIAPTAVFTGTGKIIIHNPGENPFYKGTKKSSTNIDGNNGTFLDLLIEHNNNNNVVLADVSDPGYGTSNPAGVLSASLNLDNTLDLAVNGANIILNGHDLSLSAKGKINNFSGDRMVVTNNSITGHLVKEIPINEAFTFPIGIAQGDYTPAILQPAATGKFHVSVQDYFVAAKPLPNEELGMDRMWHIYTNSEAKSKLTLQHNLNTNGALFKDNKAAINRFIGGGVWQPLPGTNPAEGVHTSNDVSVFADAFADGTYFSKLSSGAAALNIPNLFTPNGDGNNDAFVILGLDEFRQNSLVIVNRWSNEVYHAENYQNNWTGEGLNEGTYYYVLKVRNSDNSEWTVYKAWLTLIRRFKQ